MDRAALRTDLRFRLNVTEGEADQDFSEARLNAALQYAYNQEVEKGKQHGFAAWFKKTATFTWPAGQLQVTLPDSVVRSNVIAFYDITSSEPGTLFVVQQERERGGSAWWYEHDKLNWAGNTAPTTAKTLRVFYLANAETLANDAQSPQLIPPQFHQLVVIAAAVHLREVADESAPLSWLKTLEDWRFDFWKSISKGRPFADTPTIQYSPYEDDED